MDICALISLHVWIRWVTYIYREFYANGIFRNIFTLTREGQLIIAHHAMIWDRDWNISADVEGEDVKIKSKYSRQKDISQMRPGQTS